MAMFAFQVKNESKTDEQICKEIGIIFENGKFIVTNIDYNKLRSTLSSLKNSDPTKFAQLTHFLSDFCNSPNAEIKQKGLTKTDVNTWIVRIMEELGEKEKFNQIRNTGKTNSDWTIENGKFKSPVVLSQKTEKTQEVQIEKNSDLSQIVPQKKEPKNQTEDKKQNKLKQTNVTYSLSLGDLENFKTQAKTFLMAMLSDNPPNQKFLFSISAVQGFFSNAIENLDFEALHYFFIFLNTNIIKVDGQPTSDFYNGINSSITTAYSNIQEHSKIYSLVFLIIYNSSISNSPLSSLINYINFDQNYINTLKAIFNNNSSLNTKKEVINLVGEHLKPYLDLDSIFKF